MRVRLYILSLWLLFVLVIVLTVNIPVYFGRDWVLVDLLDLAGQNYVPIVCFFFMLFGFYSLGWFEYKVRGTSDLPFMVTRVKNANFEHLAFLATYIVPLIGFNFDEPRYLIVLAFVLVIVGAIYVRTNIFYANPTLALLGFKVYRCVMQDSGREHEIVVITRSTIRDGDYLTSIKLDDEIYYARKK